MRRRKLKVSFGGSLGPAAFCTKRHGSSEAPLCISSIDTVHIAPVSDWRLTRPRALAAAVADDPQEPRREGPERFVQRLLAGGQRLVAVAAPVPHGHASVGHGDGRGCVCPRGGWQACRIHRQWRGMPHVAARLLPPARRVAARLRRAGGRHVDPIGRAMTFSPGEVTLGQSEAIRKRTADAPQTVGFAVTSKSVLPVLQRAQRNRS